MDWWHSNHEKSIYSLSDIGELTEINNAVADYLKVLPFHVYLVRKLMLESAIENGILSNGVHEKYKDTVA